MATRKVVVEGSSVTASQLKDLFRQIEDGSLRSHHIQALLEHRNPFNLSMDKDSQLSSWRYFFAEIFSIQLDIESLVVPKHEIGFERLIVIPTGLTIEQVFNACRGKFSTYSDYEDSHDKINQHDRYSQDTYVVWVRERREADEELSDKSAQNLVEEKVRGITILERLLYELKFFDETGNHLDVQNATLCSGSRDSNGEVPQIGWYPDEEEFRIDTVSFDEEDYDLRSREVIA